MKRITAFTLMNGREFVYNQESDLFESADGYCLERMPGKDHVKYYDEVAGSGRWCVVPF